MFQNLSVDACLADLPDTSCHLMLVPIDPEDHDLALQSWHFTGRNSESGVRYKLSRTGPHLATGQKRDSEVS